MTRDEMLTGWLVFLRSQEPDESAYLENRIRIEVPESVSKALVERGWIDPETAEITDAGVAVSDMAAAEWGIDAIDPFT
jgi:hypothetical protein